LNELGDQFVDPPRRPAPVVLEVASMLLEIVWEQSPALPQQLEGGVQVFSWQGEGVGVADFEAVLL
jgi:hypothetical protein